MGTTGGGGRNGLKLAEEVADGLLKVDPEKEEEEEEEWHSLCWAAGMMGGPGCCWLSSALIALPSMHFGGQFREMGNLTSSSTSSFCQLPHLDLTSRSGSTKWEGKAVA
jgi:hypothetical protein